MLPVIIIGGFRSGIFTPTEAGVVATFYALIVSLFIYRELPLKHLPKVLLAAAKLPQLLCFGCRSQCNWLLNYCC